MNSWHRNRYNRSGKGTTSKGGGPFVPLKDGILLTTQRLDQTSTREAGAHRLSLTTKEAELLSQNEIRKDMTTSVTYEQAHTAKMASDAPW